MRLDFCFFIRSAVTYKKDAGRSHGFLLLLVVLSRCYKKFYYTRSWFYLFILFFCMPAFVPLKLKCGPQLVDATPDFLSCGELNLCCCVILSQTTALDKEKQIFRRRRNQDVKPSPHPSRSIGANTVLSPAGFTPESEDYSPGSADTVRSPTSPF